MGDANRCPKAFRNEAPANTKIDALSSDLSNNHMINQITLTKGRNKNVAIKRKLLAVILIMNRLFNQRMGV